ncbi:MAG: MotA/TolQ/ExbB proton channel family protein [Rhodocyclaceae bacterium]|nr:MotA/TolQ/ExbB proton channel family protein [Rhodocyclaceae bacterium]
MELLAALENFLFQVSSALYGPVIFSVSLLAIYVAWLVGSLAADAWLRRRRGSVELASYQTLLAVEAARAEPHLDARLERLLQEAELAASIRLDRVRFVIKVGPALGLMGTLIPMGISLAALAEGNVPKMAGSMVTAFTATVAGLGAGVVAYLVALVREKWVRADVREMEYQTEVTARQVCGPSYHSHPETHLALPEATPAP